MVLTPQFGPRQRFISIVTNAPIEPDPVYNGKICKRCFKCVEVCPVKAISKTEGIEYLLRLNKEDLNMPYLIK